ncbi:MAG: translation initiation factor IF-2 [Candidatus Paceibacterota bacterium]
MVKNTPQKKSEKRPPIVVVMGHIDHGKSTLLDYIRKSNVAEGEVGGITQHISAYVVEHTTSDKSKERITFLDTPGHEAFQKMRLRGAEVADVAILVVSAEDGVKPQTLEALHSIIQANIPYVVAINKVDKPGADIAKTQASLIENEIYIEGMGGDIPWAAVSAKTGEGISDLLDVVVLAADMAELKGDPAAPAEGTVVEARVDTKRGNTATLIVKNGTLRSGDVIVSGTTYSPVRIMEDFTGTSIKEAGLSQPIGIVGFGDVPNVGDSFYTVKNKKEAEKAITEAKIGLTKESYVKTDLPVIPILIRADVSGTIEAIKHELEKFASDRVSVRIIDSGVGAITRTDVQNVSATKNAIIVGFNVKVERPAQELAERLDVEVKTFSIIYELAEWFEQALIERTPKREEEVMTGKAKILRDFSTQKNIHVLGGRLEEGTISLGQRVRILRRDLKIGVGIIRNIQQQKSDVKQLSEGEFGMQLETKADVSGGDFIEAYDLVVT